MAQPAPGRTSSHFPWLPYALVSSLLCSIPAPSFPGPLSAACHSIIQRTRYYQAEHPGSFTSWPSGKLLSSQGQSLMREEILSDRVRYRQRDREASGFYPPSIFISFSHAPLSLSLLSPSPLFLSPSSLPSPLLFFPLLSLPVYLQNNLPCSWEPENTTNSFEYFFADSLL